MRVNSTSGCRPTGASEACSTDGLGLGLHSSSGDALSADVLRGTTSSSERRRFLLSNSSSTADDGVKSAAARSARDIGLNRRLRPYEPSSAGVGRWVTRSTGRYRRRWVGCTVGSLSGDSAASFVLRSYSSGVTTLKKPSTVVAGVGRGRRRFADPPPVGKSDREMVNLGGGGDQEGVRSDQSAVVSGREVTPPRPSH